MKKIIFISILSLVALGAYAQSTDTALKTQADVIRNETVAAQNSKTRVANMFQALTDSKVNRAETLVASGTNTYTVTANSTITSYTNKIQLLVQFTNGNTGAATLNVNGLGAKAIKKNVNTALSSGDIAAGQVFWLVYDGTNFQIEGSLNAGGGGGGSTAGAASIGNVAKQKFVIEGYAIVRLRNSGVDPGNGNMYIKYELLDVSSGHESHFIYGAHPNNDQQVHVDFPPIKEVYYGLMIPDDALTSFGISMMGTGVNYTDMQAYMRIPMATSSYVMKISTINGTPQALPGGIGGTISVDGSGNFSLNIPGRSSVDGAPLSIFVRKKTGVAILNMLNDGATGIGTGTPFQFCFRDASGTNITTWDSSATDGDFLVVTLPVSNILFDSRYTKGGYNFGDPGYESTYVNFFALVKAEAWMISSPVSSTSTLTEWQAYPLATDYQLYRSTGIVLDTTIPQTGNITSFTGETLVHSGTDFSYTDTGLSANTQYWYRLKGTVNGVANTVITWFDVKTNP